MAYSHAHLKPESPFYSIFERGLAPIKNILVPHQGVQLEGSDETEAYMLDWAKCSNEQRSAIAILVTQLRGGTPAEFLTYMSGGGELPIRVSQTSGTSTDSRAFLPDYFDDDDDDWDDGDDDDYDDEDEDWDEDDEEDW